jgi:hypothetical protein
MYYDCLTLSLPCRPYYFRRICHMDGFCRFYNNNNNNNNNNIDNYTIDNNYYICIILTDLETYIYNYYNTNNKLL